MKKILIAAYLVLCAIAASGQSKLIYQNQDPKTGFKALGTSQIVVRTGMSDRHPLKLSLMAIESEQGWSYMMNVAVPEYVSRAIPKGSILLVRSKSGEVFEFANILEESQSRDWVGEWIEGTATKMYDNKATYPITRDQLEALCSGVLKVRLQLSGSSFDTEYKKDKFGAAILEQLAAIDAGISSGADLRSDF